MTNLFIAWLTVETICYLFSDRYRKATDKILFIDEEK